MGQIHNWGYYIKLLTTSKSKFREEEKGKGKNKRREGNKERRKMWGTAPESKRFKRHKNQVQCENLDCILA